MPASSELEALRDELVPWLVNAALPRWLGSGRDPRTGGFVEGIGQDGVALSSPRRARVPPRQIYSIAKAAELGSTVDARPVVVAAYAEYQRLYRRDDGYYRTLVAATGEIIDDSVLLYDQCFVLLALNELKRLAPHNGGYEAEAVSLRERIVRDFAAPNGGFYATPLRAGLIEANPHMHLLEACLGWAEDGGDAAWGALARDIAGYATRYFIRGGQGALFESCTPDWGVPDGIAGRLVEPGHLFEWAWLLLREARGRDATTAAAALQLIEFGERHGVKDGFAFASVLDDGTVHDPVARLWPQTERLKAALAAMALGDSAVHEAHALAAGKALRTYLATPLPGLWLDARLPDGTIAPGPAPASTFYHLVCAIHCLVRALP